MLIDPMTSHREAQTKTKMAACELYSDEESDYLDELSDDSSGSEDYQVPDDEEDSVGHGNDNPGQFGPYMFEPEVDEVQDADDGDGGAMPMADEEARNWRLDVARLNDW